MCYRSFCKDKIWINRPIRIYFDGGVTIFFVTGKTNKHTCQPTNAKNTLSLFMFLIQISSYEANFMPCSGK